MTLKVFESQPSSIQVPSWSHPLSALERWHLTRPRKCENEQALKEEFASSTKDQIWFVDVQPQKGQWILFCSLRSSSELFQRWQEGLPLSPLLPSILMDERFVIFNVHASQRAEAESFLEVLKNFEKSNQIGVISPSRIPIETIRKKRPQWFFGADRSLWTKVLTFESLHLLGLVNIWADFYIFTEEDQRPLSSMKNLIDALSARNKVLIKEQVEPQPIEDFYRGFLPVNIHKD